MKLAQNLGLAIAGVVFSFAAMESPVKTVLAATITYDFTVDVTSGSLVGTEGFGSFSYDNSTLNGTGLETLGVNQELSISFNFVGKSYSESNDIDFPYSPVVQFQDSSLLGLNFLVQKPGFAFEISGSNPAPEVVGGDKFIYGDRPNIDGEGAVTYSPRPVPEPNATLGLVAVGLYLLLRKLNSAYS